MEGPKIQRLYYSAGDVSEIVQIPTHVLRSWEKKFPRLKPSKSKSGRRLFKPHDLNLVMEIKALKGKGYTDEKICNLLKPTGGEEAVKHEVSTKTETARKDYLIFDIYSGLKEILHILDLE